MEDVLLPAYQKLFAALQSLERFNKGQDLFENIACIDSFLSEFRNITFVLQKSLAHTEYLYDYNRLRDKYLKNEDCSWLVEKRNEVLKENPFSLEKTLRLMLFHPNGAGVFASEAYTIEDEKDYSALIEMIKREIEKIPAIEVFFSVDFVYREVGSERNLFETIDNGIDSVLALLTELNNKIGDQPSKTRTAVVDKIKNLHFHYIPKEAWFIDDYAYYRKDNVFEKGTRFEIVSPFKTAIPYTYYCKLFGVGNDGRMIEETFEAFERMHTFAFAKQKEIAPTLLILREDGVMSMVMYHASLKTTTYRKIHEIAEEIKHGKPIVAVFHVCEMIWYNNSEAFNQDYSYRLKSEHSELLSFNMVTKEGAEQYSISSEAVLEGEKDCMFPKLMKIKTDDTISYMNPLVEAFRQAHHK